MTPKEMEHIGLCAHIQIKRLTDTATIPTKGTAGAAAFDLYADQAVTIMPGERALVKTNITIALPSGYCAYVRPRSGLALKNGVTVLNTPGLIDTDYRGELGVILINQGHTVFAVKQGDRIAQLSIHKVEPARFVEVSDLDETSRGAGGFGSTGV